MAVDGHEMTMPDTMGRYRAAGSRHARSVTVVVRMPGHAIHTEIDIDATSERVWSVLTDFRAYPEWNPFIVSIEGEAQQDAKLVVRIEGMTFKPTVLAADPQRELRWLGRLVMPGLFDGNHRFVIEDLGAGHARLTQTEEFSGLLVPLFRGGLERKTKPGFEAMNEALKARAEA
jgi:hypothetical protein